MTNKLNDITKIITENNPYDTSTFIYYNIISKNYKILDIIGTDNLINITLEKYRYYNTYFRKIIYTSYINELECYIGDNNSFNDKLKLYIKKIQSDILFVEQIVKLIWSINITVYP